MTDTVNSEESERQVAVSATRSDIVRSIEHEDSILPEEAIPILVIDNSKEMLLFVNHVLKKNYSNIRTAASVKEALPLIREEIPALILCDVIMPDTGGFAFYDLIQRGEYGERIRSVPFIFMSGCSDEYMKKLTGNLGVDKYIAKPFSKETLLNTVKDILKK